MDPVTASLPAFLLAATLITITPGLDTALVLRTAAAEGSRPALRAALGIVTGCLIWAAIVAAGLAALLAASRLAYMALRFVGAGYLIWLGARMLLRPRTGLADETGPPTGRSSSFARGALTNLLNPKVGVFYVSFLPQFAPHGVPVGPFILLLGAIHAALSLIWFAGLIAAVRPIAAALRRPGVVRTLDRITGGVFLAFGIGLALESRRAY